MITPEAQAMLDAAGANIRVAASQVSRRYREYVTFEDLYQEAISWVLAHPGTVQARLDDGRRGSTRLTGQIAGFIVGLARKEKAQAIGYNPDDEAFYTRGMVEALLPAVWDDNYMESPPSQDGGEYQKQKSDPSTSGTWLAMACDVRKAWGVSGMNELWRDALTLKFRDGYRVYQVASDMHIADSTAATYLSKGVRSLINQLGGSATQHCEKDCECTLGNRTVISNSSAAAQTSRTWDA